MHDGGSTWFFISADTVFGRELQADTSRTVIAAGGRVMGSERYAFPATGDFEPQLRTAMASGATVLGLAAAGSDLICAGPPRPRAWPGRRHARRLPADALA